ncbi:MAG: A/G-specific adenine glycosylase [Bacteroidales bacterium]|nr:A/G-specific adenine glycosylase [Bacteroidales bacterium]
MEVSEILIKWYHTNKRDLPWRKGRSAYNTWLSEVILQQTRVNQGLQYYNRFVQKYPRVEDLANAPLDEVLKLWQGLGYYTRARNMHQTARVIANEYKGIFPSTYQGLLALRGIGPYSAAAIASIAFNIPVALVDGNVFRVLSRLYGITTPIDTAAGKAAFAGIASEMLNKQDPGTHNQALMEFGSLVCTPRNPLCDSCVLGSFCRAKALGIAETLPVKEGRVKIRTRYFYYLFVRIDNMVVLHKRTGNDIWNSLYEFPLIEKESPGKLRNLVSEEPWKGNACGKEISPGSHRAYKHKLTHQILHCSFYLVETGAGCRPSSPEYIVVPLQKLKDYPVPRVIDRYLNDLRQEGVLTD